MIIIRLLLFCFYYHLCADQWQHFNVAIMSENQEEIADLWQVPEPEFQKIDLPIAIFSRFVAGMAGGYCGEYIALSYDLSEDDVAIAAVTSSIASMISMGFLLQNQKVARTINNIYRSCIRRCDRLAEDFIGGHTGI